MPSSHPRQALLRPWKAGMSVTTLEEPAIIVGVNVEPTTPPFWWLEVKKNDHGPKFIYSGASSNLKLSHRNLEIAELQKLLNFPKRLEFKVKIWIHFFWNHFKHWNHFVQGKAERLAGRHQMTSQAPQKDPRASSVR